MAKPSQFKVKQAWIAFKINDTPTSMQENGDFNVLAMMDAAIGDSNELLSQPPKDH